MSIKAKIAKWFLSPEILAEIMETYGHHQAVQMQAWMINLLSDDELHTIKDPRHSEHKMQHTVHCIVCESVVSVGSFTCHVDPKDVEEAYSG